MLEQHIILSHFLAQYAKGYHKSSRCGTFEAEHPNSKQTHFFNP